MRYRGGWETIPLSIFRPPSFSSKMAKMAPNLSKKIFIIEFEGQGVVPRVDVPCESVSRREPFNRARRSEARGDEFREAPGKANAGLNFANKSSDNLHDFRSLS
jgi:hypothetical protein